MMLKLYNTVRITDRAKDVIKSGGEWISSIDVENLTMGCPGVAEAAVIGVPHPKWEERPLLVVVPLAGATETAQSIAVYLEGKIAKWRMDVRAGNPPVRREVEAGASRWS